MRPKKERKHGLTSGIPCRIHKCVECCIETRMPLSSRDIERIVKLGFKLEDFTVEEEGEVRLRNVSGRCFFLTDDGCKIYPYRPEGCRLYPLIYDERSGEFLMDTICPYRHEFKVKEEDKAKLLRLLERLSKETKTRLKR